MTIHFRRFALRSSRLALGFCLALLPVALLPFPSQDASPAQQAPATQGPILKVQVNVVNVYAVVRDHKRLVPDLTKDAFEVTEDNVPQDIKYFSKQTDTPVTLVLAVDTSPSQGRVLMVEQEAAKQFASQVMRPKDEFAVLHFDVDVELLQDFTGSLPYLNKAIDSTQINGGGGPVAGTFPTSGGATHLYDAVYLASHDMLGSEAGRKVIILLTDGEDEGSRLSLDQGLQAAQRADVIIYSILISDRAFYMRSRMSYGGEGVLNKLSTETGGHVFRADNQRNTSDAFNEIAAELRTQYLLGYTPSNNKTDGTFRHLKVRLKDGHGDVQARRGYYAPSS
ncbi:MAG TPA: VWA domain-containing protein [Terriglobia bacterium]|jgi:VWFA-related protein|nr:VWA domain-containing protein [Terriglobia bacterium]